MWQDMSPAGFGVVANYPMLSAPTPATTMPAMRIERADKVVCAVCHTAKSACDGLRPCGRCVRLKKQSMCLDYIPKRRGRKKRADGDEEDDIPTAAFPPSPPVLLPPHTQLLLIPQHQLQAQQQQQLNAALQQQVYAQPTAQRGVGSVRSIDSTSLTNTNPAARKPRPQPLSMPLQQRAPSISSALTQSTPTSSATPIVSASLDEASEANLAELHQLQELQTLKLQQLQQQLEQLQQQQQQPLQSAAQPPQPQRKKRKRPQVPAPVDVDLNTVLPSLASTSPALSTALVPSGSAMAAHAASHANFALSSVTSTSVHALFGMNPLAKPLPMSVALPPNALSSLPSLPESLSPIFSPNPLGDGSLSNFSGSWGALPSFLPPSPSPMSSINDWLSRSLSPLPSSPGGSIVPPSVPSFDDAGEDDLSSVLPPTHLPKDEAPCPSPEAAAGLSVMSPVRGVDRWDSVGVVDGVPDSLLDEASPFPLGDSELLPSLPPLPPLAMPTGAGPTTVTTVVSNSSPLPDAIIPSKRPKLAEPTSDMLSTVEAVSMGTLCALVSQSATAGLSLDQSLEEASQRLNAEVAQLRTQLAQQQAALFQQQQQLRESLASGPSLTGGKSPNGILVEDLDIGRDRQGPQPPLSSTRASAGSGFTNAAHTTTVARPDDSSFIVIALRRFSDEVKQKLSKVPRSIFRSWCALVRLRLESYEDQIHEVLQGCDPADDLRSSVEHTINVVRKESYELSFTPTPFEAVSDDVSGVAILSFSIVSTPGGLMMAAPSNDMVEITAPQTSHSGQNAAAVGGTPATTAAAAADRNDEPLRGLQANPAAASTDGDGDGVVYASVQVNKAFERLFGWSQEDIRQNYLRDPKWFFQRLLTRESFTVMQSEISRSPHGFRILVSCLSQWGHSMLCVMTFRTTFDESGVIPKTSILCFVPLPPLENPHNLAVLSSHMRSVHGAAATAQTRDRSRKPPAAKTTKR